MIVAQWNVGYGRGTRRAVEPRSFRAALVGDSLTDLAYSTPQPTSIIANGISGAPLQAIVNIGVAGNSVANLLSRIDNSYTASPPGLAGVTNLGFVILRIGTNNTRGGASITSGVQADYIALFAKLKNYADVILVCDVPPISSPESGAGVNSYNTWLDSYCAGDPRLWRIKDTITVNDGTGAWASGYAPADGIHFKSPAAGPMGLDGSTSLAPLLAGLALPASPISTDPADKYPAQPQWNTNHVMAGTSGVNNIGSGQVVTGITVDRYGAGFAATTSIVAADGGDPNTAPWQRVTPTQITSGAGAGIQIGIALSGASITTTYPDQIEIVMQVRFNAFAGDKFDAMSVWVYGASNEELTPSQRIGLGIGSFTTSMVFRTALPRKSTGRNTHASASLRMFLEALSSFTGSMGSVDLRCATVRVLA